MSKNLLIITNDFCYELNYAGGDNISITKGVVNRVEVRPYNHSKTKLMTTQIDAAINHGNSGGPVVMENKIVGVAFQCLKNSENVG